MPKIPMAPDAAAIDEYGLPTHPPCPFCDGHDTELLSPFGSVLSVAVFWCRPCHTAFELVKWRAAAGEGEKGSQENANKPAPPNE